VANAYDQDGDYADGCECKANSSGNSCPGTAVNAPAVVSGRVLPTSAAEWWQITFPSENGSCGKHYVVNLVTNGNPVGMTVAQNCSGTTVSCNAGGDVATNYVTWDFTNSGNTCTQGYPVTYYVQVLATGSAGTCMDYSLVAFVQ
jgi:hypothetical protein